MKIVTQVFGAGAALIAAQFLGAAQAADLTAMNLPPALADTATAVVVPPVPGRKKDNAKKEPPAGQIVLGTDDQPVIVQANVAKPGIIEETAAAPVAAATPPKEEEPAKPEAPAPAPAAATEPVAAPEATPPTPPMIAPVPARPPVVAPEAPAITVSREWSKARDVAREYENIIVDDQKVTLTEKELQALELTRAWRDQDEYGVQPMRGEDGAVEFTYGLERPSVVCAVLNVTDIELQPGETVSTVNIGDSRRWLVKSAVSRGDTQHLIVKPLAVGLSTSMVVATDRRTYHVHLRSTRSEYMARVRFVYGDDAAVKLDAMKAALKKHREDNTLPGTHEYLGNLNFDYEIKGKAGWKPVRVYNDGVKTILEMPQIMSQTEAPSLLIVQAGEQTLVNYRVQNNRYIVDSVFDKAILITGVGRKQTKVTITYKGRRK